jgi:hypothetical protein
MQIDSMTDVAVVKVCKHFVQFLCMTLKFDSDVQ